MKEVGEGRGGNKWKQQMEFIEYVFLYYNFIDQMDKSTQNGTPEIGQQKAEVGDPSDSPDRSRFFQRIERFLQAVGQSKAFKLQHFSKGFRIILTDPKESLKALEAIATDIFDRSLKEVETQFHRFGISIAKKKRSNEDFIKMTFRFNEPINFARNQAIMQEEQSSNLNSQQQIADEFPKVEQTQQIIKSKGEQAKGAFHKSNLILSKAKSQNMLGSTIKSRNVDQNSLQVQLYEQDPFSTPSGLKRKDNSSVPQSEEEARQSLQGRSSQYRQNYEKCSKLIDNTMMEILTAHRQRRIGDRAEEILNKVIEIYDLLSDNIENVNEVVREFEGGQEKKERIASPGFKPLN